MIDTRRGWDPPLARRELGPRLVDSFAPDSERE